jgi:hypothetical protein
MQFDLSIRSTEDTPFILFSGATGLLELKGRSLPEDAFTFYQPILHWLSAYEQSPNSITTLHFNLEYFNTASAKQIYKIFSILASIIKQGKVVKIKWHFDEGDKDMIASGERFSKLFELEVEFVKN